MAKELIEYNIHPTSTQYKIAIEDYLTVNKTEFWDRISNRNWNTNYKENLATPVIYFNLFRVLLHTSKKF